MAVLQMVRHRFYNNDGTLASGGKVYTYEPGTSTAKNSYTDHNAGTANAWPLILDAKGEGDYWVSGSFKINVLQSDDVQITGYPVDYILSTDAAESTPNAALNPNFDIAQRGASFVSPASGAYDMDGWLNSNTSAAAITVIQGTGPTTGSYSRQVTVTTADTSIAAGDVLADQHRITGYDIVDYDLTDNTFTVSFWAKFPLTGIHCVALRNSGGDRSYVHEITVAAADTWAEYQFTVDGGLPTAGTWNYTTGIGLKLDIVHAAGSTYQTATTDQWVTGNYQATANQVNDAATVSNVWAIAKVKINKGIQLTNAAYNKPEMWLRCQQRYPELLGYSDGVLASFGSTTVAYAKMSLAVEPLVPITGISVSATTDFTLYATASTSSFSSIAFQHAGPRSVGIAITASAPLAGAAAGYCGSFIGNATIGAKIFGLGAEI